MQLPDDLTTLSISDLDRTLIALSNERDVITEQQTRVKDEIDRRDGFDRRALAASLLTPAEQEATFAPEELDALRDRAVEVTAKRGIPMPQAIEPGEGPATAEAGDLE